MDMEWAKHGETGELYIVRARPETVQATGSATAFRHYRLKEKGKVLATGAAIGSAIASGRACVIRSAADIADFQDGAVLVTEATDPDWVPIRSEEHTSELQSLMRISYAVFCLKKKRTNIQQQH